MPHAGVHHTRGSVRSGTAASQGAHTLTGMRRLGHRPMLLANQGTRVDGRREASLAKQHHRKAKNG